MVLFNRLLPAENGDHLPHAYITLPDKSELYNLKDDPAESTDLSTDYPEKKDELKKLLGENLAETNARFPQPDLHFKEEKIRRNESK